MTEPVTPKAGFSDMKPTQRLDMLGQTCPVPTTETLRVLEGMAAGEVLEVESDYYPAKWTIPHLCDEQGYPYALSEEPPGAHGDRGAARPVWRIRIQKT